MYSSTSTSASASASASTPYYSRNYGRSSNTAVSSSASSTAPVPQVPGAGGVSSSQTRPSSYSHAMLSSDRPSTLSLGGAGGGVGGGHGHLPNKPSRYTPSSMSSSTGSALTGTKSSSYGALPPGSYTSYGQGQGSSGGPGGSSLGLGLAGGIGKSTVPVYDVPHHHSSYYSPGVNLSTYRVGQSGSGTMSSVPVSVSVSVPATSKSTQNLMVDHVPPDVFCLSCPPAEYKFSDAYRAKTLPRTGKENERLIGFATLPEQVHRKSVKKGFDFTLMVVGESGLGKSTLVNSLFLADFYQTRKIPNASDQIKRTTAIQKHTIEIEERGVKLRLTVVDTPGFGDAVNGEDSWKTCVDYIDDQFQQYFQAESGLNRRHIQDTRVHCCLYFVPSLGHGLRQLDIEVLRTLQARVNVIPVIAKADTLTPPEVRTMKDQVLEDMRVHGIQMYQFPDCDEDEDDEFKRQDRELKAAIPFAVASSDTFVEVSGRKIRGRQYPWGIVEVENPSHSDFSKLRTMLIQSHMHDLKETTQDLHYENFRAKAIAQISQGGLTRERNRLKRDSSSDSSQEILQQKEAEIQRMQQMISRMEAKLKAQNKSARDSIIDL